MNKVIVTLKDGRTFEHEGCVDVRVNDAPALINVVMNDGGCFFYNFACVECVHYETDKEGT